MIPTANLPFLLSGLPERIDPQGLQAQILMESLPDEFWDRLEAETSEETRVAALTWGKNWIAANWRVVLGAELCTLPPPISPALLEACRNARGENPLSLPSPVHPASVPGSLATAAGHPIEAEPPGLDLPPDCPDEAGSFDRDLNAVLEAVGRLLRHLDRPEESTPWWRRTGDLKKEVEDALGQLAEWSQAGEDPQRDGWVDGRGRP